MNFETIDWNAEAKRVARAFEIEFECVFKPEFDSLMALRPIEGQYLKTRSGNYLVVLYDKYSRNFSFPLDGVWTFIRIGWCGQVDADEDIEHISMLPRALFYLGLLAPEVEAALNVAITAHQKLEWTLEFGARSEKQ